ncbi:MAG: hypothetical protein PHT12_06500 [Patescibacteria group bacterium]|nr:hypothetical protein [Patescibacteria group bacterium]
MLDVNDREKFKAYKEQRETFYKTIGKVFCPVLKCDVHFTADGFHHLQFDGSRCERSKVAQYRKFRCIENAVDIIGKSATIQEYRSFTEPIGKVKRDGFRKTSLCRYWAFSSVVGEDLDIRIKAIVRQVGEGQVHFWSVMPTMQVYKKDDGSAVKVVGGIKLQDE